MSGADEDRRRIRRWEVFEVSLTGPSGGNPFTEVDLRGVFQYRNRRVSVPGFYDGDGRYRVRFSPDQMGAWTYRLHSNVTELDGGSGGFECVPPSPGVHGPVRVVSGTRFQHADGTRFLPFGTTCYHWTHQMDTVAEERTLRALAASPFNKVRMCVLPTEGMRPPRMAFPQVAPGVLDKTRFDPVFFAHLERRIADLAELGIEADIILFHPYDRGHWGVDDMTRRQDERYLRYVLARLGSFRNVWWSVSNEFDFNRAKTMEDWDHLLRFVQRHDPYRRLRSIHNGTKMYEYCQPYDFTTPWTSHQSIQHWNADRVPAWLRQAGKPVIIDEIGYEGDIERRWGNLTAEELVDRIWSGFAAGGAVTHGECFTDREFGPWISVGGDLYGQSTPRIAFLRRLLESRDSSRLHYFGGGQPGYVDLTLPPGVRHRIELVDAWNMTVTELDDVEGDHRVRLPGRSHTGVLITRRAVDR